MRKNKRGLTLLEVMIALILILMASGVVGMKMHEAVSKKRFQSDLERLQARCLLIHELAVGMQIDWTGQFKKEGSIWVFEASCDELKVQKLSPLRLKFLNISFNQRKEEEFVFDFFSSGRVLPEGIFSLSYRGEKIEWKSGELFQLEEGEKEGPLHPDS